MSENTTAADPAYANSEYHKRAVRHLVAGVALPWPNSDPHARPPPPVISYLYTLKQRKLCALQDDDRCVICWNSFESDGPEDESDVFLDEENEVALVLPCCRQLVGSSCIKDWFGPIERNGDNSCPYCCQVCFPRREDPETVVGHAQLIESLDWVIQETKRRVTEGPEEWKQDARECLVLWENAKEQNHATAHNLQIVLARVSLDMFLRDLRPTEEPSEPNATPRPNINTLDMLAAEISRQDTDWALNDIHAQLEAVERDVGALNPEDDYHVWEPRVRQIYWRIIYNRLRLEDEHNILGPRGLTERPELTDVEHRFLERTRIDYPEHYAEAKRWVEEHQDPPDPLLLEPNEHRELIERQRDILDGLACFTIARIAVKLNEFAAAVRRRQRESATRETTRNASHVNGDTTDT